jgi:N-dimethylarginine dimethylaminohydrolase
MYPAAQHGDRVGTIGAELTQGCQSMTAKLRRVLLRNPADGSCARWRDYGWRSEPDHAGLLRELEGLGELLEASGAEVVFGEPVAGDLDAIYAFDPALVTRRGAIVLRLGKELRRPEMSATAGDMARFGIPVAATLEAPATAEGGDLLWLDEQTLLVGRGYRTNAAGVDALRAALPGVEVIEFDLPHFHGPREVMHLLSLINLAAPDLAVVYLPLAPVRLVELLAEREVRIVEVPDDEFESMGPNVVALEPGVVLALARNRETQRRLEQLGVEVLTYEGTELSKGDGGPGCLTRPLLRHE